MLLANKDKENEMIRAQISIDFINLGVQLENLGKSIKIGSFEIAFYGMIISLAIITGIVIACAEAKRTGQNVDMYMDFALYVIIACIIGARIYYVAFEWDYYSEHLSEIINLRKGGLAIYGAVIAAVITAFIYGKLKKVKFGQIADTGVLGLIAGQIIGRWGNFFNREAFGGVVSDDNLFAMRIYFDDHYSAYQVPEAVAADMEKMVGKTIEQIGYIQVQPTFLYESCWNLMVLILMLVFRKYKKFQGEVFLWYLAGYGLGRSIIEGMRTDQLIMPVTGWPVSQALSIVLVVVSIIFIAAKRIQVNKASQEQMESE